MTPIPRLLVRLIALLSLATATGCGLLSSSGPESKVRVTEGFHHCEPRSGLHQLSRGAVNPTGLPSTVATGPLHPFDSYEPASRSVGQSSTRELQAVAGDADRLEMRLLVITATCDDYALGAIQLLLEQLGTPFDTFAAADAEMTEEVLLAGDGEGRYYGVFLTSSNLSYQNGGGNWVSGFTNEEWATLWEYERLFGVRQVSLYTYPSPVPEDYGIDEGNLPVDTSTTPLTAGLTTAGSEVFGYLRDDATIEIHDAYTYRAELDPEGGISATPLLEDADGYILGVLAESDDGRERLALTMAHNPYLLHTQLLGYGLVQWATRGMFLGNRRLHLQIDVDDYFQHSDVWDPATDQIGPDKFRLSASDALAARDSLADLRSEYAVADDLTYVMAFNGNQAYPDSEQACDVPVNAGDDALTAVTKCLADDFSWLNHTYTELPMDDADYSLSRSEIELNTDMANSLGLTEYSPDSLLTGGHSGLGHFDDGTGLKDHGLDASNPELLKAAKDAGVRYMGANHSVHSHRAECGACGVWHPLEPEIMLLPRFPTNVYYNVVDPEQVVDQYNYYYGPDGTDPYWPADLNYETFLDVEARTTLYHILSFSPYPHFFHQANLHEYAPGRSLVLDWTERVVDSYGQLLEVPLVSLNWSDLAQYVERRTAFHQSRVMAVWDRSDSTVTISSETAGPVLATGLSFGSTHGYGDETLSWDDFDEHERRILSLP